MNNFHVVSDGHRLPGGIEIPNEPRGLLVLLHGIPSVAPPDPSDEGYAGLARAFAAQGWAAAWANMRGVQGSQGFFSIEGWVRDARAIMDEALAQVDADLPKAYVASSGGGAAASEAVRRGAPADALVLLATPAAWMSFAAGAEAGVARVMREAGLPLAPETLADPTSWAAEFERVSTEVAVADLEIPILVVHGTEDVVVPVDHAVRIADAGPTVELRIFEGAPHKLRTHPGVFELVCEWLESTLVTSAAR